MRPKKGPTPKFLRLIAIYLSAVTLMTTDSSAQIQVPGGKIYQVSLQNTAYNFTQKYTAFIPDGVKQIRGVLIHQHGCTMEGTGEATAYDIQYQALAKKWDLAIVGPDLYHSCYDSISGWTFPEKYSGAAIIHALDSIGQLAAHDELHSVPWLLWGHSGGGHWVLAMAAAYPERTLAVFAYSPAFDPQWNYPTSAAKIPIIIRHAGASDFNSPIVDCWGTALHSFDKLRKMNGYVSLAYTSGQTHNLSFVRYMAIPFYEAVLAQRLPDIGSTRIKDMDPSKAWLGDTATNKIYKSSSYQGDKLAMSWLPDSTTAHKWQEYVNTSTVSDKTPPPIPFYAEIENVDTGTINLSWRINADLESGVEYINIYKNAALVKSIPYQTFSTNGDNCSPLIPENHCTITDLRNRLDTFSITAVNHFQLESPKYHLIRQKVIR